MREWLQGRVGRLLLATLLLSAAVALTGACGDGSDEPSPTAAAVEAPASTPIAMPATSVSTMAPTPTPTPTPTAVPTPTAAPTRAQTPTPTPTPTPTAVPTPTLVPTATPESTPEVSHALGDEFIELDEGTIWQEVFDVLSAEEQTCIRDMTDEDGLGSILQLDVLRVVRSREPGEFVALFCLEPEKALFLYASVTIASMGNASSEMKACTMKVTESMDLPAVLKYMVEIGAAEGEEEGEPPEEVLQFITGMLACP